MNVAIVGAGSIGNHLAYSARKIGWEVSVFDSDLEALDRFKSSIFPSRYGSYDSSILLSDVSHFAETKAKSFDVILIGTPPDTHLQILRQAVKLQPKFIFIEKPLCTPSEDEIFEMREIINSQENIRFFCGYNHRLNSVTQNLIDSFQLLDSSVFKLEVKWLESWNGIMQAHPWIKSPGDTYLGSTTRGGGALFEHSHGIDLWINLARYLGLGIPRKVKGKIQEIRDVETKVFYDAEVSIEIETNLGFIGTVTQDVISLPSVKQVAIEGESYNFLAQYNHGGFDKLSCLPKTKTLGGFTLELSKPRPSDFDPEIAMIDKLLKGAKIQNLRLGLDATSGLFSTYVAKRALDSARSNDAKEIDTLGWEFRD